MRVTIWQFPVMIELQQQFADYLHSEPI